MIVKSSVILLSGGLDSATAFLELVSQNYEVYALSLHYGQRHSKELEYARKIAKGSAKEHRVVDLSALKPLIDKSSQTGELDVPEGHYTDDSMKQTVVPNRNMIMLSIAIGWAVNLKADSVTYAAHSGDHTIYPDCRPEFASAMDDVASICDWHPVRVYRPFIRMTKTQIVQRAAELGLDFENTWSCYKGLTKHCGICGTCTERREAFAQSGVSDPTLYEFEHSSDERLSHL